MTEPHPDDFTNFAVKYARRWRREGQYEYAVQADPDGNDVKLTLPDGTLMRRVAEQD